MRFNKTTDSVAEQTKTTNYEGGEAFEPVTPERALYTVVINNLLEDTTYRDDEEALREVVVRFDELAATNPEFALKLAAHAREAMYLRDISQVLLVLAAHDDRTKQFVRKYAPEIIQRADEPCTVVAISDEFFGIPSSSTRNLREVLEEPVRAIEKLEAAKQMQRALDDAPATERRATTLPKPLKKGINDALHSFDEYQFAKYDRKQREVNIRDVINRTHPNPQDAEHVEIFERLMLGDLDAYDIEPLKTPETWEVVLSEHKTERFNATFDAHAPDSATGAAALIRTEDGDVEIRQNSKTGEITATIPGEMRLDRIEVETAAGYPEQPTLGLSIAGTYDESNITVDRSIPIGHPVEDVQLEIAVYVSHADEAWQSVLPKMGLFAIIRNVRNMRQAGVPEEAILEELDLEWVRDSKLYPFRFYQSYTALQEANVRAPQIERWLSEAIDISSSNVPDDLSETLVAADLSGSMDQSVSGGSDLSCKEISALFAAMLGRKGAVASGFGETFEVVSAHVETPTLELAEKIHNMDVGHSTNGWKAIRYLRENQLATDRIVLLTDDQLWDSTSYTGRRVGVFSKHEEPGESHTVREEFKAYRDEVAPEATLYIIDLSSYGTLSTPEGMEGVYRISGWSEKVLDFIGYAEDEDQIIDEIEAYEVA